MSAQAEAKPGAEPAADAQVSPSGQWWGSALDTFFKLNEIVDPVEQLRIECVARMLLKTNPVYGNVTVNELLRVAVITKEAIYR